MSDNNVQEVRKTLETLAEVSRDLDRHTQLSKTANHPIQAQQVRKRINELTQQQTALMDRLVDQHPNQETKSKFKKMTEELDQLRSDIRGCNDKEELAKLESTIDEQVNRWVHQFQIIVSELTGIQPPAKPVFDNK